MASTPLPTVVVALLPLLIGTFAGCADDASQSSQDAPDEPNRSARVAAGAEADHTNMTKRVLAQADGSATGPGRFEILGEVPGGGAVDIEWEANLVGLAGPTGDRLDGPGCIVLGWGTGAIVSQVYGRCDDLPAGDVTFQLVLEGAATDYEVLVSGWVPMGFPADAQANATEP